MVYSKVSKDKYLIRLAKGENVGDLILKFCEKLKIKNAYLTAIGAVKSPALSYYDVESKKFLNKTLEGDYELTSFMGNIAIFKNKPILHAHATVSDKEMRAYGGHFVISTVAASVEIILTSFDTEYEKTFNEEIGLNLWDLPQKLV